MVLSIPTFMPMQSKRFITYPLLKPEIHHSLLEQMERLPPLARLTFLDFLIIRHVRTRKFLEKKKDPPLFLPVPPLGREVPLAKSLRDASSFFPSFFQVFSFFYGLSCLQ
ncbi:hypothetical protein VNO77_13945 [Canavalia gladiata]|uniref:Uncharacterized protein n=1 Tax=Canavalia gladiata TaxID=3824 RepID=A0AAN9M2A0_CANGL